MKTLNLVAGVFAFLMLTAGVAGAQDRVDTAGTKRNLTGGGGEATGWGCDWFTFPAGTTSLQLNEVEANATLYVCTSASSSANCYSSATNRVAGCSGVSDCGALAAGSTYLGCLYAGTSGANVVNGVVHAGYLMGTPDASTAAQQNTSVSYYVEFFKDNLFLGIAYHRIGCLDDWNGSAGKCVSDLDYDGFSDADYCRKGTDYNSPTTRGTSNTGEWVRLGTSYADAVRDANYCGEQANSYHGHNGTVGNEVTKYKRRPAGCSYNIFTDCNSDCWIHDFSSCLRTRTGATTSGFTNGIVIAAGSCVDEM